MAYNSRHALAYFLKIKTQNKADLGAIRHFQNLQVGFEGDDIWIKNWDEIQINALEVKCLVHKEIYYENEGKLYLQGSLLPSGNIPALLWTPILRGVPLELPDANHNFFGISEQLNMRLVATESEREAVGMIVKRDILGDFIETAPAIRLKNLKWALLDSDKAFVLGTPLLPIQGEAFWQNDNFLLPLGYRFDLFALSNILNNRLNPTKSNWLLWQLDNTYLSINKRILVPLSISSFRKTKKYI